ncbi:MAG TPA: TonB family protein [Rhizomicrobium sp.]|nr:TonB family protein [Rhizomicrobium sp.]
MEPLNRSQIKACNHPRLTLRFALAFLLTLLLVPLAAWLSFLGAITLLLFWLIAFVWLARETLYAHYVANMILVSELNYPRIDTLSEEMRTLLGVRRTFSVFVFQMGEFNAFMMRLFRRRAIFLPSEILETGVSDDEVRWIIGRFVGYWRSQQDAGVMGWMIRLAQKFIVFDFFMLPYERAMVYTGDRLGLAGIGGDIGSAISAMQKLLVGRQLGYSVNPVGVIEQRRRSKGSLFGFLARITSGFPHTIARYVDLIVFAKRQYPEPYGRFESANPGLAHDLEMLSGERTGGASLAKGVGFLALIALGVILTIVWWAGMSAFIAAFVPQTNEVLPPAYQPMPTAPAPSGPAANGSTPAPPPQDDTRAAPPADPAAPPAAPDHAAPPTTDGSVITDPVFTQQLSLDDVAKAYPEAARSAGVSGSVVVQCSAETDGSLSNCATVSETPTGYGFGDAAIQLMGIVRLAPQSAGGVAVAGGVVRLSVPFTLPP